MNLRCHRVHALVIVGTLLCVAPVAAGCARTADTIAPTSVSAPVSDLDIPVAAPAESTAIRSDWSPTYTPTVLKADVAHLSSDDVVRELFTKWLEYHKSTDAGPRDQLTEYDVMHVEALDDPKASPGNSGSFGGMVRFSVKPVERMSNWRAGNGVIQEDWIRGKFLFVRVDDGGDSYSLHIVGTGP